MGPFDWVAHNLGLTVLTLVCFGLILYLVFSMIHPEEF